MKAGLVGPSYLMRAPLFNAERTINWFPVLSEVEGSKDVAALYTTPGLVQFADLGGGPIRGILTAGNGRTFALSGNEFYEIASNGTATLRGTVSTFNGNVSMAENGLQLMVATGAVGYIFTFATNGFVQITDVDFPGADYVSFQDGYFIATPPNNQGKFYISGILDGLSWDALDFATAESATDGLVAAFATNGSLLLFGDTTTEIWSNNGSASFPYSRLSGGIMQTGCASAFTIVRADNTVFWLGQDTYGAGIVYKASGTSPQRISTQAIEFALANAKNAQGNLSSIIGFCYQQEGHLFYVLTGGGLETSFVYDVATNMWHERAYLSNGSYEQWLGVFSCYAFGKNLTGDRRNGLIYSIDLNTYTDNGDPIKRRRVFTHLYDEGNYFKISSLQVDFEPGVGLTTGQGSDPQCWLRMSTDFGNTWSSEYLAATGKLGQYWAKADWRRLGVQRQMTFEVSISDPVKANVVGAYFNGR